MKSFSPQDSENSCRVTLMNLNTTCKMNYIRSSLRFLWTQERPDRLSTRSIRVNLDRVLGKGKNVRVVWPKWTGFKLCLQYCRTSKMELHHPNWNQCCGFILFTPFSGVLHFRMIIVARDGDIQHDTVYGDT